MHESAYYMINTWREFRNKNVRNSLKIHRILRKGNKKYGYRGIKK